MKLRNGVWCGYKNPHRMAKHAADVCVDAVEAVCRHKVALEPRLAPQQASIAESGISANDFEWLRKVWEPRTPKAIVDAHVADLSRPVGDCPHGALTAGAPACTSAADNPPWLLPMVVTAPGCAQRAWHSAWMVNHPNHEGKPSRFISVWCNLRRSIKPKVSLPAMQRSIGFDRHQLEFQQILSSCPGKPARHLTGFL